MYLSRWQLRKTSWRIYLLYRRVHKVWISRSFKPPYWPNIKLSYQSYHTIIQHENSKMLIFYYRLVSDEIWKLIENTFRGRLSQKHVQSQSIFVEAFRHLTIIGNKVRTRTSTLSSDLPGAALLLSGAIHLKNCANKLYKF